MSLLPIILLNSLISKIGLSHRYACDVCGGKEVPPLPVVLFEDSNNILLMQNLRLKRGFCQKRDVVVGVLLNLSFR